MNTSRRAYKRGVDFPHEGFVQLAIERHYAAAGFEVAGSSAVDLICVHPATGESWHIEAKGVTAQVGLDFRTGLGQLLLGMRYSETNYGLAIPDTPAFRLQVGKLSEWVVAVLRIHWLFVAPDGSIRVVVPQSLDE